MPWWNKKYGKNSLCAITHTRLRSGKNKHGQPRSIFLNCKHGFCRSALQSWSILNSTCPLCRTHFDPLIPFIVS